jgi:hypothetical protein
METLQNGKKQGVLTTLDREGDTKIIWDPENEDEVAAARQLFDSLKEKRFVAYSVTGKKGEKGEVIKEFDPELEMIIMSPPMVGG